MPRRTPPPASGPHPRAIDAQGRVLLPREILDALGVGPGDWVGFAVEGDEARIYRVKWAKG